MFLTIKAINKDIKRAKENFDGNHVHKISRHFDRRANFLFLRS